MRLIALCGAPGAGKTAVQEYLRTAYGVRPADDGWCLRDFAMRHLGLSEWHVKTQEGKASMVTLPGGKTMTAREALGEFGNRVEEVFGPDAIPEMALMNVRPGEVCSFGSTRRHQGHVYKRAGGIVVEIVRPGHGIVNAFDWYDPQVVDITIPNNSSIELLHHRIDRALGKRLHRVHSHA